MQNEQYLNEERYQKNIQSLKKLGKTLLIIGGIVFFVGLILIIVGFVGFGNSVTQSISSYSDIGIDTVQSTATKAFGNMGILALGGLINSAGFILLIVGGVMLFIAHRREIKAFAVQQVMPVAQEGINKMAPTIGNAAKEIAKGIKEGINESDKKE